MRYLSYICIHFVFIFSSCVEKPDIYGLELKTVNGQAVKLEKVKTHQASVFIFLSPECPLCVDYTPTIKDIQDQFSEADIQFYGVFPGTFFSLETISSYIEKYALDMTHIYDPEFKLTHAMGAGITPEVFLLDKQGRIRYEGAIDNWIVSLGRKRNVITEHYLKDAISNLIEGKRIKNTETQAIGCLIE